MKNLLIFFPILFAFDFSDYRLFISAGIAAIGFSFIASSIYVINDLCDIETDRAHPSKKNRPLASGAVSKSEAIILIATSVLIALAFYTLYLKNISATVLLLVYFFLNLAYSFKLKQIAIIDVVVVATGFVIRIVIGGMVTNTHLSHWIVILTFLLALLLALGKRRDDVLIYEETKTLTRKSIQGYNIDFLNVMITLLTIAILVSYIMYTVSPDIVARHGNHLYISSLFVLLGLMRYLQIIYVKKEGGDPTAILIRDHAMHFIIAGWVISFFFIAYLENDL